MREEKGSGRMRHFLVVEDEPQLNQAICALVRRLDWDPISCLSGEEALTALKRGSTPIQGALIDLRLPNCPGIEVARRLRTLHPNLPILVTSGAPTDSQGTLPFLPKPFGLQELRAALLGIGLA